MRQMFSNGQYRVLGEVGIQYRGIEPGDARFEPYLAMAEQLDIPVGIHIGPGPPGAPYLGTPAYRARLHSPLILEEPLIRHPKLRIYAMHAGWPMLDDTLTMLWTYPQLYIDVGVISFAIPQAEFHAYLRRIVQAGFGKRVLFGSDQMVWPEALEIAIQSIEKADFLSPGEKRDILYNNAARFLRLSPEEIWRHHGK
jgi:predicted TIM-barrel fold metal-dependent hydrolase